MQSYILFYQSGGPRKSMVPDDDDEEVGHMFNIKPQNQVVPEGELSTNHRQILYEFIK